MCSSVSYICSSIVRRVLLTIDLREGSVKSYDYTTYDYVYVIVK